jgi:[ribosomal protein S18]-alanine N-acetyltransferase
LREIRPARAEDLAAIAAIQASAPEAAHWPPAEYLEHECEVVCEGGQVVAFLVARSVAPDESELLNLVVAPEWRRRGLAKALVERWISRHSGDYYLEVRESNSGAQTFYQAIGFKQVGIRPGYYDTPPEAAIVLKFYSC